jgi:hypothetical protein
MDVVVACGFHEILEGLHDVAIDKGRPGSVDHDETFFRAGHDQRGENAWLVIQVEVICRRSGAAILRRPGIFATGLCS